MADATAPNTESVSGDVEIKDIGPAAKRLTITVSAETITEKIEGAMGTLASQTSLPGFRKGRAPRRLLERRFGTALRDETRNQIIADAYAGAIEEHEIRPVGDPEPVEKMEELVLEAGKPLTFSVDVEVVPEFALPGLEGLEIRKPMLDITDELVQNELDRYREQLGEVSRIDSDFTGGDRLAGPITATIAGESEPFFTHERTLVVHPGDADGGRGQVLGLLVDDLGKKLDGCRITDTITIKTTGPEGHEREDIRGKDLVLEFEISQVERVTPATAEHVYTTLGLSNEEILREQIGMSLQQRRDEEQAGAMRQQVADQLIDQVEMELPEKLSQRQVSRMLERQRLEMLYAGISEEDVETRLAEIRADSEAAIRRRIKLSFLLASLAEHFGVEVSQQEINGRIATLAARRGVRPEQLMNELNQSGEIQSIASQIRENKALDRVVHQARVEEVSAEQWRKEQEGAEAKKKTSKKKTKKTGGSGASATTKKTGTSKKKKKKTSTRKTTSKK